MPTSYSFFGPVSASALLSLVRFFFLFFGSFFLLGRSLLVLFLCLRNALSCSVKNVLPFFSSKNDDNDASTTTTQKRRRRRRRCGERVLPFDFDEEE